jgi:hypothetical protein
MTHAKQIVGNSDRAREYATGTRSLEAMALDGSTPSQTAVDIGPGRAEPDIGLVVFC